MSNNDLVIGAVTKYKYEQIEPWIVSLDKSGYKGRKALILYNIDNETIKKLEEKNVILFAFKRDDDGNCIYEPELNPDNQFNIVVERFAHMWYFLRNVDDEIDHVIATDVKDVIFQRDPSEELRNQLDKDKSLVVGSENFRYKDEPWSKGNMYRSFGPLFYDMMKEYPIYCAGVIAGKKKDFLDLCMNVFMYCRGSPSFVVGGGGPDQAALNIYLTTDAVSNRTKFASTNDSWVVHAGTSVPAIKSGKGEIGAQYTQNPSLLDTYRKVMLHDDPVFIDGVVCNNDKIPYAIVHQYDRVNEWKDILDKKYRV